MDNHVKKALGLAMVAALLVILVATASAVTPGEVWVFPDESAPGYEPGDDNHFLSIQAGIDAVSEGGTVNVAAGTYTERLLIDKPLDLYGAQFGVDPTVDGARTDITGESVVDLTGLPLQNPNILIDISPGVSGVTVAGFTLVGGPEFNYADESTVRASADNITIKENIITGYTAILYKGPGEKLTVTKNRITGNKSGITIQPGLSGQVAISHNIIDLGTDPAGDESGIYLTNTDGCTISNNTVTGFLSRGIGGSDNLNLAITGNTLTGNRDNISLWGATTFVTIVDNNLLDAARYGINIKGQDITITGNVIANSADSGIFIDRHTIDTERITINDNKITGSAVFGVSATVDVTGTVDATANWWGDPKGPEHESNPGGAGDKVSDGIDFDPWYVDEKKTKLSDEVTVTVKKLGRGTVTGAGTYTTGDNVTLIAVPYTDQEAEYIFAGWFIEGQQVNHGSATFAFTAEEDVTVYAVFFWWLDGYSELKNVELQQGANAVLSYFDGNVTLSYNPAARDTDGRLAVTLYGIDSDRGVPGGLHSMGIYINFQHTPDLDGIPARLEINYDPDQVPEEMLESSLKIYRFDEVTGSWVSLAEQGVDTANKVVWAQLNGFSTYSVFAGELPATGTLMIYLAAAGVILLLAGLLVTTGKKQPSEKK